MTTGAAVETAGLDAVAQAELVRRGEVTAAELVGWAIERIEDLNPILNAVITPMYDQALAAAAMTPSTGRLAGVPYLVKDLIAEVAGVPFSEGSRFLRGHVSHFDSELVLRLRRAGLIIVGKTNTPEFGMAPTCEPVLHGPTRNPWDTARSTSGSSGGSAAAVAARMVPMAHGNDLGGSIRYPASACGLFGLKPTRARNPLGPEYGDAVNGWACEHALTRTVRDSAVLLDATAGPALGDPYGLSGPARPFADEVGRDPGRLRIGYTAVTPEGLPAHPDCVAALDDAVALCASLGHELAEAGLPGLTAEIGAAIGSIFGAATAWIVRYWIRRLGRRPADDELEPLTRAYWEMGQKVSAADYLLAIEDCQAFARRVAHFLPGLDVWLTPPCRPRLPIGEITRPLRTTSRPRTRRPHVRFGGCLAIFTGSRAISVPRRGTDSGMPIGVHWPVWRRGDIVPAGRPARVRPPLVRRVPPPQNRTARHGPQTGCGSPQVTGVDEPWWRQAFWGPSCWAYISE
jgi:amidase